MEGGELTCDTHRNECGATSDGQKVVVHVFVNGPEKMHTIVLFQN